MSVDTVRLLIGDTVTADRQLTDPDIQFFLTENGGNVYLAGSAACMALAAKYARSVDTNISGEISRRWSQRQKHYLDLAKQLKQRGATSTVAPFAGGTSRANKETYESNTDRVEPAFSRDLHSGNDA